MNVRALLLIAASFSSCEPAPVGTPRPVPETRTEAATYEVRGVVRTVDADRGRTVIAHEKIEGYMDAMTMEFRVAPGEDLATLAPGDRVAFRLTVSESESRIDGLRKIGRTAIPAMAAAPPGELPMPGMLLADAALMDQDGRPLRLSDFQGRALAITFIFTRCPLPDFCPRMSGHFAAVQRGLTAAGAGENWHLLSITIDPAHDTPERLAAYAKTYARDPERWTFATGDLAEIRNLGAFFGLAVKGADLPLDHNLRTAVIDPAGRVRKVFNGNDWQPADLVAEMKQAMAAKP